MHIWNSLKVSFTDPALFFSTVIEPTQEVLSTAAADAVSADNRDTTALEEDRDQAATSEMADQETSNGADGAAEGEVVEVPKKNQKPKEPPVTFREFNVSTFAPLFNF